MYAGAVSRTIRDGDWELLKWDPVTGKTVWILEDGDKIHTRTDYPVAKTLEQNAEARNNTPDGWRGDWHRVASLPMNLLFDDNLGLMEAHAQGDDRYVRRWLNDGDNIGFRTKEGSL